MTTLINPTVTVFGGTGHYGRHITAALLDKGIPVSVLTRSEKKAKEVLGDKVKIVEGSVIDLEKISQALMGSDAAIFCLSAMTWNQIRMMEEIEIGGLKKVMEEMSRQHISRLIFISVFDIRESFAEEHQGKALADTKSISEKMIKNSGMNWTVFGCPPSYELFFRLLRKNSVIVPGGGNKRIVSISPSDVGEIVSRAVLRQDLSGRRFRLTGPQPLSFPEFTRKISEITGRKVSLRAIPLPLVFVLTGLLSIINPLPLVLYRALVMMNHFPEEIADGAFRDLEIINNTFGYSPVPIEEEIRRRFHTGPPV